MNADQILRNLDLSEYEIKCYLALAQLRSGTVSAIARQSGVPRNKAYEVLAHLQTKGLVIEQPTKPLKFSLLSLEKLKELVLEKQKALQVLEQETDALMSQLSKHDLEPQQESVWIIQGQKNIVQKIAFEMKKVKKESVSCVRSLVDDATNLRNTKEAIERGVRVKMIVALTPHNLEKLKKWKKLGVEFRVYDEHKFGPHGTRFSVFDQRACRLTIGKPEVRTPEEYVTIWSESPSLVNLFRRQFYTMWGQCKPLEKVLRKKHLSSCSFFVL